MFNDNRQSPAATRFPELMRQSPRVVRMFDNAHTWVTKGEPFPGGAHPIQNAKRAIPSHIRNPRLPQAYPGQDSLGLGLIPLRPGHYSLHPWLLLSVYEFMYKYRIFAQCMQRFIGAARGVFLTSDFLSSGCSLENQSSANLFLFTQCFQRHSQPWDHLPYN